ncbi:MAG TPA: hypothetical protein VG757_00265 [Devosia sp.]|nr:hypothetical protein [Devosia sp.]
MLAESLVYVRSLAATPAPFRPFLGEAVGLWARGRRRYRAWIPHLSNCLSVLDTTIDDIGRRRTVAVLGSGPLFDIPLESLARNFERVLLVDQAHLATIDHRLRRYRNITRIWRDLAPIDEPAPLAFLDDLADLDWVISANLLSQIAGSAPAGDERRTIDRHLAGLAALSCQSTLLTDIDYRVFDHAGTLLEDVDLMHGRSLLDAASRWLWEVAPFGEEAPGRRRVHTVVAFPDWCEASR